MTGCELIVTLNTLDGTHACRAFLQFLVRTCYQGRSDTLPVLSRRWRYPESKFHSQVLFAKAMLEYFPKLDPEADCFHRLLGYLRSFDLISCLCDQSLFSFDV